MTVRLVIFFFLLNINTYKCLFYIDLLKIPPGFRVGMDLTSKGMSYFSTKKNNSLKNDE